MQINIQINFILKEIAVLQLKHSSQEKSFIHTLSLIFHFLMSRLTQNISTQQWLSNFLIDRTNLRYSTLTEPLFKHTKRQSQESRSYYFCEQYKKIADKDERIQQLLQQKIKYRNQKSGEIIALQTALQKELRQKQQILKQNQELRQQIILLKSIKENREQEYLNQLQYIKVIKQEQRSKQLERQNRQQERKVNEGQFCKLCKEKLQMKDKQKSKIQQEIQIKQQIMGNFASEKHYQQKNSYASSSQILKMLSQKLTNLNISQHYVTEIIQFLAPYEYQLLTLFQQNKNKERNIESLKQIIEQKLVQRDTLVKQNKFLMNQVEQLNFIKNQLYYMEEQLQFVIKDKEKVELEMFRLKIQHQQQRNQLTFQIRNIIQEIRDQYEMKAKGNQISFDQSKSKAQDLLIVNLKEDKNKLNDLIKQKDDQILILKQSLQRQSKRFKNIMSMANQFNEWFQDFEKQNYLNKSNFYLSSIRSGNFSSVLSVKSPQFNLKQEQLNST